MVNRAASSGRPTQPSARRRALPALAALAALALLVPLGAFSPPETADAAPGPDDSAVTASTPLYVTLITGDRVALQELPGGRTAATVEPAPRPHGVQPQFLVSTREGQTSVVPSDVAPLLPDVLDPALFNVTSLVEQGYHDAARESLPVIVSYPDDRPRAFRERDLPSAEETHVLESVHSVAADVDRADVSGLANAVFRLASAVSGPDGVRRDPSTLSTNAAGPLAGVDRIWLDGRVEANLDRSTAQVSAPAAWAAGYDGSGVTVAVLDTGIDTSHPDLADAVSDSRNFTDDPEAADEHGHGTHVASIVAGDGTASDGSRRGVAPGAELISGKVLGWDGSGQLSWIIEGMEWAAGEAGADIVNMSLGADPAVAGNWLVNQALDDLTAANDVLFVAAAGNNYCDGCIDSPGDAANALTVGAVDREDGLADFSSRGPTLDGGLKPDITAPGVDISAARAEGTGDIDGPYISHSGTSMATPHVAGAAALLAQAHPEFTAQQLKAALMSTAVPSPELTPYEQGAGRLDAGRIPDVSVYAVTGSVDFGRVEKENGADPLQQDVTYQNLSDAPVELHLATSGELAGLAAEPETLTVPAGGTATARLTLDLQAAAMGRLGDRVTAELPSGETLTTPVGVILEPRKYELRLQGIARDGRPALPWVGTGAASAVIDAATGEPVDEYCSGSLDPGELCFRVPAGTYSVLAFVETAPIGEQASFPVAPLHTTLVGDPEVEVTGDLTLTLDAREAVEVTVQTPAHPDARAEPGGAAELGWTRRAADGTLFSDFVLNGPGSQAEQRFFVQPMDDVTEGLFETESRWRLEEPSVTLTLPKGGPGSGKGVELDPYYYRMDWFSDYSTEFPRLSGRADLRVVDAGEAYAADLDGLDLSGALALVRRSDDLTVAEQSNAAAAAGARMVAIYNDRPGVNVDPGGVPGTLLRVPTVWISHEEGMSLLDLLTDGPVTVRAEGTVAGPYVYDLMYVERDGVPEDPHYVARPEELVRVDRTFHSQGEQNDLAYSEASYAFQPTDELAMTVLRPFSGVPRTRVDYHVPDPRTQWSYSVTTPEKPHNNSRPHPETARLVLSSGLVTYRPGERVGQSWLRQPLAPGLNRNRPVVRDGDRLVLGSAMPATAQSVGMVDAEHHFSPAYTNEGGAGLETWFTVERGDEVLWETEYVPGGPLGFTELPTGDAETYRMSFDVTNHADWAQLSTRSRTEWTFSSARTEKPAPVPLLTLDYDLAVDLRNRATGPAGRHGPNEVEVTVGHQAGLDIPVTGLRFEVSYDDGKTWREVPEHRRGDGRYTVHLPGRGPGKADYVSFRVEASDADGNRIAQEIIRATALP